MFLSKNLFYCVLGCLWFAPLVMAQAPISPSAYRVLGQRDLQQRGLNMVLGVEMNSPASIALDPRAGALHLYVSDTGNNRVLAWQDARSYQIGDQATLVLGQPTPYRSDALGIGLKGFSGPSGLAVDPITGNLYVTDYPNNRILRFANPFANPSRVEPDLVYGQPNFSSGVANPTGVAKNSLNRPRAIAFDQAGNMWVADTLNNRILRFNAAVLNTINPEADLVLGQKDFTSGGANRSASGVTASGFDNPTALAFDPQGNLYVADYNNTRVLKFAAPIGMDQAAVVVFGQANFTSRGVPLQASATTLAGPSGVAVDGAGNLFVAVPIDSRILVFATSGPSGAAAKDVLGQVNFTSTAANPSAAPYASSATFAGPVDVKTDSEGNLFVADTGNNRVLAFPRDSKSANRIWGQNDFSANSPNQIKAGSINAVFKMAIDYTQAPYPLYVSDTNSHRILIWRDASRFRTGDPADLVIGQPNMNTGYANVDTRGLPSSTSFASPAGIALDAVGNLYVADAGNNRVLRFPRPIDQGGRITADTVIGQTDFTSSASAAVTAGSLKTPTGVAVGSDGNLFVSDSGNNRVLEFPGGAGTGASAIRVYGQSSFNTGVLPSAVSAQTLAIPQGICVDSFFTLYVVDAGANRVLVYTSTKDAPAIGAAASFVIGQPQFSSAAAGAGPTGLRNPTDVAVDSSGKVYVSDRANNRVLIFPSLLFLPLTGAAATGVVGQNNLSGTAPDWNSTDLQATPEGLFGPLGLLIDRKDTLYVGDSGNNRVMHFLKSAAIVQAANPRASLAPGALASVFGAALSDSDEQASGMPLPSNLANREVDIDDTAAAPVSSVASGQIDFQVPSSTALGTIRIAVRTSDTGELIAGSTVPVAASSPGLFTSAGDGTGQGKILNQDGTPNSSSNPAARGSVIKLFGTGQGPVSPPVADGAAAPTDPPASTVAVPTTDGRTCLTQQPSVCVAIGSTGFGDIQFSGLKPGGVGTWQIDVKIPSNTPPGNAVPLRAVINGVLSNIVSIAIK